MSTPRCPNEFIFNLIIRIGQLATTESTGIWTLRGFDQRNSLVERIRASNIRLATVVLPRP
jgi:hypothetical protein